MATPTGNNIFLPPLNDSLVVSYIRAVTQMRDDGYTVCGVCRRELGESQEADKCGTVCIVVTGNRPGQCPNCGGLVASSESRSLLPDGDG